MRDELKKLIKAYDEFDEWKALQLSEKMRSDIAMASVYADEVAELEAENAELRIALEEAKAWLAAANPWGREDSLEDKNV